MFLSGPGIDPSREIDLLAEQAHLIDVQFLATLFYGVGQMTHYLRNCGHDINPKRIRRLMRQMALMPIYQVPNTCQRRSNFPPGAGVKVHHLSVA